LKHLDMIIGYQYMRIDVYLKALDDRLF